MKRTIGLIFTCIATNVFAQAGNSPANKLQPADAVELVSLDQMPISLPPGEAEKMRKNSRSIASDGFSSVEKSPETVKGFFNHMNMARTYVARQAIANTQQQKTGEPVMPEVHNDLSKLRIHFRPKALNRGALIAAAPSGTLLNGAWTGVERFFQIAGAGSVRLSEVDLGATGGKFYMMKEAVNARVRGNPAISKVFTDDDGQTVEEVVWVEAGKFYMLTFGPDLTPGTKSKVAAHVTAHLLAQELF